MWWVQMIKDIKQGIEGQNKAFGEQEAERKNVPLLRVGMSNQQANTTNQAQNNASGSNASLDKSLAEGARKILGASEGGATPQMNGSAATSAGNSLGNSIGSFLGSGQGSSAASAGGYGGSFMDWMDLLGSAWGG